MAIPEAQLETWTAIGSVQQSSAIYQTIKRVLEHADAPYASRSIDSFLQGSYGNDTNIYGADSDVDIVLRTKAFFHYDIDALSEAQKTAFKNVHPSPSQYDLPVFKREVILWLDKNYGTDLDTSGKKALRLKANGNRRSSDILLVAPHKRYTSYWSEQDKTVVEGVLFFTSGGSSIINYPKQHSENMTAKHQETSKWFKPTVRIYKNMRNRMVRDGFIKAGTAPSYFIEGMLWNVPKANFGETYQKTVEACWGWINSTDAGALTCANGIHPLSRDNVPTSWPIQGFIDFLQGVRTLWTQWK
jgi:hypothetical protein